MISLFFNVFLSTNLFFKFENYFGKEFEGPCISVSFELDDLK